MKSQWLMYGLLHTWMGRTGRILKALIKPLLAFQKYVTWDEKIELIAS